eukprot:760863-Hanusia_phi.AAC.2
MRRSLHEAHRAEQEESSARVSERTGDELDESSGNSSEWLVGMAKAARELEEERGNEEEEERRKKPGERGYWQMRAQLAGVELGRKERSREETGLEADGRQVAVEVPGGRNVEVKLRVRGASGAKDCAEEMAGDGV